MNPCCGSILGATGIYPPDISKKYLWNDFFYANPKSRLSGG
jgi:hypothetical protein